MPCPCPSPEQIPSWRSGCTLGNALGLWWWPVPACKLTGPRGHMLCSHRWFSILLACSAMFASATPWTVAHQAPLSMRFSSENTGESCRFLLQGIFPTQGSNPHLPCWQMDFFYFWATWELPLYAELFIIWELFLLVSAPWVLSLLPTPVSQPDPPDLYPVGPHCLPAHTMTLPSGTPSPLQPRAVWASLLLPTYLHHRLCCTN